MAYLFSFYYYYYLFIYLFLTAFGLECYACTNQPELIGGTKCESDKAEKITCEPLLFNRCMTVKYTMSLGQLGSRSVEQRNCSNSVSCDLNNQFNRKCKNSYYLVE